MSYKIFISHAGVDAPIARAVRDEINKTFGNKIELFLAQSDISSAAQWKEALKINLEISDAIICILTPDSIYKPWIYVEWSPFWLGNKTSYILHLGDISVDSLLSPMQERQATNITDTATVNNFYKSLAKESKSETPSFDSTAEFVAAIEEAQNIKLENSYGIYRKTINSLPTNDSEKKQIARFFYDNNETDIFIKISKKIRNDSFKLDLIVDVLYDSKFSRETELKIVNEIVESINSADKVGEVSIQLIKLGYLDSPVLREILDGLSEHNLAELRKVAIYLIDIDQEDTDLFSFICENMTGNFAEFRKIVKHIITSGKFQRAFFSDLIAMFGNYVELKKIGFFMIEINHHKSSQFKELVKLLSEKSHLNYKLVLERLLPKDKKSYNLLIKEFGLTEN